MTSLSLIFGLSLFGIFMTLYLMVRRKQHREPYCPKGFQCQRVLESRYSHLFWVRNDFVGLIGYLVIAATSLLLIFNFGPSAILRDILIGSIAFGAAVSLALIYIQKYILHAWCFICVISALNMFTMTAIFLFDFL